MVSHMEKKSLSHVERTSGEPREKSLHTVTLNEIEQVNDEMRVLKLVPLPSEQPALKFLPGQWLDVHIPSIPKAGGFTITSPPSLLSSPHPYLELAVQRSPSNPAAVWLWRPSSEILHSTLNVRVGGSFVWPPKVYDTPGIKRVVFIAGGVGINPLMSILSHISELPPPIPFYIKFIYTFRASGSSESICSTLFLERLAKTFANIRSPCVFEVFITKTEEQSGVILCGDAEVAFQGRRINVDDLLESLGPLEERAATIVYVCGVPEMTDKFVETIKAAPGMNERHVLCEKWW